MLLTLRIEHLLQVSTVLDELIGLKVAPPSPGLLERIDLPHRIMGSLSITYAS
jgi:hypothetical protein